MGEEEEEVHRAKGRFQGGRGMITVISMMLQSHQYSGTVMALSVLSPPSSYPRPLPSPSATASCLPLSKHIGRDSRGFPNAVPRMRERPRGSGEGDEGGRRGGSQERRGEGRGSGREGREASRRDVGDNLEEEGREVREQGEISMGMEDEDLARMQVRPLFLFLPPLSST